MIQTEAYLLARQAPDGAWPDYPGLEVGPSLAWTTAYVGFALSSSCATKAGSASLRRAAKRLRALERPDGWGYNESSASDADSTAWAVRFLHRLDALRGRNPRKVLIPYVEEGGAVRTFRDPERFGSWSGHSDEVAPVLALALQETGASLNLAQRIAAHQRSKAAAPEAPFKPFWWDGPDYALCWNTLLFNQLSRPVPEQLQARLAQRFHGANPADTFATSLLVLAAPEDLIRSRDDLRQALIATALHGPMTPSAWLLVPDQRGLSKPSLYLDTGTMTAATLLMALNRLQGMELHAPA